MQSKHIFVRMSKRKEVHPNELDLMPEGTEEPTINTEGRFWCLTVFPVEQKDDERVYANYPDKVECIVRSSKGTEYKIKYLRYQEEKCPKTGRFHLQMFMIMEKPIKFTVLKNAFPKCRIAMRYKKSTNKQADEYCDKEETATGKYKYKGGEFEEDQQGKRTDLELVAEAIKDGATLKAVSSMFPSTFMKFHGGIKSYASYHDEPIACERDCALYWGLTGVGKTYHVERMLENYEKLGLRVFQPAVTKDGGLCFFKYDGEQIIWLEDFDGKRHLDARTLKLIMDNGKCMLPARYNPVAAKHQKVIITSNRPPEKWGYEAIDLPAIVRRLNSIWECRMDEWRRAANPHKSVAARTIPNPNREYLMAKLLDAPQQSELEPSSSTFILPTANPSPMYVDLRDQQEDFDMSREYGSNNMDHLIDLTQDDE